MKKYSLAFSLFILSVVIAVFSCTKINEATELGSNLIPGVDNVHTFEVSLNAVTNNLLFTDSTKVLYTDAVALGDINDPEFGHTHANFCFNIDPPAFGAYPFITRPDSLPAIDSVVLSLAYAGAYGDTLGNGVQTVTVFEIPSVPGLRADTPLYRYNDPSSDLTGPQLSIGSTTYTIRNLHDSIPVTTPGDTVNKKVANVVRIKLNPSLGTRFAQFDTTSGSNGGYHSDSLFRSLFNGLAIKSDNSGNALAYFNLADAKTKLTIYYRYKKNGVDTTASLDFRHSINGQSNYIKTEPGGNWAGAINNPAADKIYLQSSPSDSYASIFIPSLNNFGNKVIHRAEIIASKIPSVLDNAFSAPPRLMLDKINNSGDTAAVLQNDLVVGANGSIEFNTFGGTIQNDNTYRFNITRHVQGIVTRHEPNDTLRLYAPLRTVVFASNLGYKISLPVSNRIANGRIVFGSGSYGDSTRRLRLRIIYSDL